MPHTLSDFVVDKIGTLFIYYSHGITTNMAMDNVVVVFFFSTPLHIFAFCQLFTFITRYMFVGFGRVCLVGIGGEVRYTVAITAMIFPN